MYIITMHLVLSNMYEIKKEDFQKCDLFVVFGPTHEALGVLW